MSDTSELEAAAVEARLARERLTGTAQALQDRLAPARLLDEAVSGVRDGAGAIAQTSVEAARRRPAVAAGAAAAVALLLLRRPLGRLGRRVFRRRKETDRHHAGY